VEEKSIENSIPGELEKKKVQKEVLNQAKIYLQDLRDLVSRYFSLFTRFVRFIHRVILTNHITFFKMSPLDYENKLLF